MIEILMFIIFVAGSIQLFKEYHYILDFKREERNFADYKKKSKDELYSIVDGSDEPEY